MTKQTPFHREAKFLPDHRVAKFLFSISLATIGGFLGGVVTGYGPTYLSVHVAQPVLQETPTPQQSIPQEPDSVSNSIPDSVPDSLKPADVAPTTTADASLPSTAEVRLVVHAKKHHHYVLISANADKDWGTSAIRQNVGPILNTLSQPVNLQAIPPELTQWKSQAVNLYDSNGFACTATVGPLLLLQQVAGDIIEPKTPIQWYDSRRLFFAAKLQVTQGNCNKATWARDARLSTPALARRTKPTKALRKRAIKAFRNSPTYKTFQSEFEAEGHNGHWDQLDFNAIYIERFVGPKQNVLFISAAVGGCGEFSADFEQLYNVGENNSLTLIPHAEFAIGQLKAAADFDGDGDLDFVSSNDSFDSAIVIQEESLRETFINEADYFFCRC